MKPLESYVSDLESPVEIIRVQTVVELVRSGDIRTVPHLKRVADNDESPQVRYLARKGLKLLRDRALERERKLWTKPDGVPVVGEIIEALVISSDGKTRLRGFDLAARLNDPAHFSVLKESYERETDIALKSAMVRILAIVGGSRARTLIKKALKSSEQRVRANAVEAAALIRDEKLIKKIVPLLNDQDHRVAANAAIALKDYPRTGVLDSLSKMLDSRYVNQRDAAAFALSRMGNESALPLLVKASQDNKKAVRLKAVKGLEVLAGEGSAWAVKVLEKIFHEDEEGMADYFTLISEEHRINDLAHPDYNIRIIAVKNLVRTADPSRLPALKESLANERDNYVKATIIKAIGEMGETADVAAVLPYLNDHDPESGRMSWRPSVCWRKVVIWAGWWLSWETTTTGSGPMPSWP